MHAPHTAFEAAIASQHSCPAPSPDDFDEAALEQAYEAFFEATTGGNFGGIRAAIKAYNEMVARSSHADSRREEERA
jgi:hypothetical protein